MATPTTPANVAPALLFPAHGPDATTSLVLDSRGPGLPVLAWVGPRGDLTESESTPEALALPAADAAGASGSPVLPEHWRNWFGRPALRGHRLGEKPDLPAAGFSWSTAFSVSEVDIGETILQVSAMDADAGLELQIEFEALSGGALRGRARVTNTDALPYLVKGLEIVIPVPDSHRELLDFTGRHERERQPQRHAIETGLWLREGRWGSTGLPTGMMLVTGTPGFSFADADVLAVHVGWSGNTVLRCERTDKSGTTIGGGELLLPGEIVLAAGQTYASPWVYIAASRDGLDGVAGQFHAWLRSLPSHPVEQKTTLNVWEAVYFDHDLDRLSRLAELAARVGIERFVLDDGWFRHRRDDHAGLGDWYVDKTVWPQGLTPLIDKVRGLGLEFGLWFEPEMINPDSDLYRAHPDWVLRTPGREPMLHRHQLALDLTRAEVYDYVLQRIDAILTENDIGFVKWDFNRDLLEAGSPARDGAPVVHEQTLSFYRLLDELRARHSRVTWESCASGGGRIDLAVLERAERVWTSDMTDALSRQHIQRWTSQLIPPEYMGAHISAPTSHQTGRTFTLDFRLPLHFSGRTGSNGT